MKFDANKLDYVLWPQHNCTNRCPFWSIDLSANRCRLEPFDCRVIFVRLKWEKEPKWKQKKSNVNLNWCDRHFRFVTSHNQIENILTVVCPKYIPFVWIRKRTLQTNRIAFNCTHDRCRFIFICAQITMTSHCNQRWQMKQSKMNKIQQMHKVNERN